MVMKTRYGGSMQGHSQYITRHEKIPTFGSHTLQDFKQFIKEYNQNMKEQGRTDLFMRKFMISPDPRLELDDEALKNLAEEFMDYFQETKGPVSWFAVIHRDTGKPHVHIVAWGKRENLTLNRDDIIKLRGHLTNLERGLSKGYRDFHPREIIKLKILGTLERHMASIYTRYVISGEIERARGIRRAMMNREKKKKKMKRLRRRR